MVVSVILNLALLYVYNDSLKYEQQNKEYKQYVQLLEKKDLISINLYNEMFDTKNLCAKALGTYNTDDLNSLVSQMEQKKGNISKLNKDFEAIDKDIKEFQKTSIYLGFK